MKPSLLLCEVYIFRALKHFNIVTAVASQMINYEWNAEYFFVYEKFFFIAHTYN